MEATHTLFADFSNHAEADQVLTRLHGLGYQDKDISVIAKDGGKTTATTAGGETAKGALGGATTGGIIGGVAGLLAGVGVVPAIAGILIGGPIAAALGLAGVAATTVSGAVTGAIAGGLIGALTKLGLSQDDAQYYDTAVNNGGVVLGVPVSDQNEAQVKSVLEGSAGSTDVTPVASAVPAPVASAPDAPGMTVTSQVPEEPALGQQRRVRVVRDVV